MDIRKLQRAIVDGLEDVKAQNIVVFNTEHLSSMFERVIIASGTSNRQTKALAASVRDSVKSAGMPVPRMEGEANGEWIIVDCGAAVVHVMQPNIRDYYHLEEIWGGKNVRMKTGAVTGGLVKASSEPQALAVKRRKNAARDAADIAPDRPASARPASGTPASVKRATAKPAAAKTSAEAPAAKAAPVKKTAARKPAAKSATAKKVGARTAGTRMAGTRTANTRTKRV